MADFTNATKNISTITGSNKIGSGWRYEEPDLNYDMTVLLYDYYGNHALFTNATKNISTITNLTKN